MRIQIPKLDLRDVQHAFDRLFNELISVKRRGEEEWFQPVYFQAPREFPQNPQENAWCIDPETHKEYFWHAGQGKWYESEAFVPVDE